MKNISLIPYKNFLKFFHFLFVKEDEIYRDCDSQRDATVTLKKRVTEYEHMLQWMVEFFSKFESRVINIAQVLQINCGFIS